MKVNSLKSYILSILFVFLFTDIQAILPPLYQTSAEISAIMNDEQLGNIFHSGEMIEKIEKNENGYQVTTKDNTVQVNVVYKSLSKPGPGKFDLHFEEVFPR